MATSTQGDVVDVLLNQHIRIKELFAEVLAAPPQSRQKPFHDLVRLFAVHETAEEELVHPLARMYIESGDAIVNARLGEELETKQTLLDLHQLGVAHESFPRRLAALRDAVVEHTTREEREEFPQLRASVPAQRRVLLAEAVRTAEAIAPSRPTASGHG